MKTLFVFILMSLCFWQSSEAVDRPPIEKVWAHREYSDPNDSHLKYVQLDMQLFDLLFSKIDRTKTSPRLYRADINNDGQQEYIFVLTPLYDVDGKEDRRLLDRIGPVYTYEAGSSASGSAANGTLTEMKVPPFPIAFTNTLEPFVEYRKQGLMINVQYIAQITSAGEVRSIGHEAQLANLAGDSIVVSRRSKLLWKGSAIKKITEVFVCNEVRCTPKQLNVIKNAKLPEVR